MREISSCSVVLPFMRPVGAPSGVDWETAYQSAKQLEKATGFEVGLLVLEGGFVEGFALLASGEIIHAVEMEDPPWDVLHLVYSFVDMMEETEPAEA